VLKAEGRDTTGKGNASALITAELQSIDENSTKVMVETDLHITGKVAQFGRGIMGDVSKKLMNQFATNLNTMLDKEPDLAPAAAAPAAAASSGPAASTASEGAASEGATSESKATQSKATQSKATGATEPQPERATGNGRATETPKVRKIEGPAAAPIELSDVAGSAVLKRLLPLVGGLVLVWLVVRRLRRR
jgi:hypothetical protein